MILLTGDIHGDINRILDIDDREMTKDDLLLVCGDFGVLWNSKDTAINDLYKLSLMNFQIAFIDGNHENFSLIGEMETMDEWNGGRIGKLPYDIFHLLRGETYTVDGKVIGVCGGANSIDKDKRIENISWWQDEEITSEQATALIHNAYDKHKGKIDIMLSHDCPTEALQLLATFYPSILNWIMNDNPSRRQLDRIESAIPCIDKWYFGHHHIDQRLGYKYRALYTDIIQL